MAKLEKEVIKNETVCDVDMTIFSGSTVGEVVDYFGQYERSFELDAFWGYDGIEQLLIKDVELESDDDFEKRCDEEENRLEEQRKIRESNKRKKELKERKAVEAEEKKLLKELKKKYEQ